VTIHSRATNHSIVFSARPHRRRASLIEPSRAVAHNRVRFRRLRSSSSRPHRLARIVKPLLLYPSGRRIVERDCPVVKSNPPDTATSRSRTASPDTVWRLTAAFHPRPAVQSQRAHPARNRRSVPNLGLNSAQCDMVAPPFQKLRNS